MEKVNLIQMKYWVINTREKKSNKKEENIKSIALNNDIVKKIIDNKNIEKIIIKYGKIISIVC